MSDEFDQIFGGTSGTRPFADRVARPQAVLPSADGPEVGVYRPYGHLATGDICETCDVQRWLDGTDMPEGIEFLYRFLLRIEYVGSEEIKLFLPDCIVVLGGKNLRDLRKKLARRQVTFVQQYSARVWHSPPRQEDPIITSVGVVRPNG